MSFPSDLYKWGLAQKATLGTPSLLVSKLRRDNSNLVLQILGDSTGNETTEWVYRLAQKLAAEHPKYTVLYKLWADATQNYPSTETISTGTGSHTLTINNGSHPGAGYDYAFQNGNQTRWNLVNPAPATCVIVSYGYNSGSTGFLSELNELTDWIRGTHPLAEVVLTAQPPLATANVQHTNSRLRSEDVRQFAGIMRFGLIDPGQKFLDYGNYDDLIEGDQVHPNTAGKNIWFTEVAKYFDFSSSQVIAPAFSPLSNRIFIDPSRFIVHTGTPALVLTAGAPSWAFDGAADESVVAIVDIPVEWNTFAAWIYWTTGGGSTNGVKFDFANMGLNGTFATAGVGALITGTFASVGTITNASSATANTLRVHRVVNGARLTSGRPQVLRLGRLATDAADTFVADAYSFGIMLVRTT